MKNYPFLVGTTSFIFHADILTNVRKLAPVVDDVEIVLFVVDRDNNLPSPAVVKKIAGVTGKYDLGFTVHLPLHLSLGDDNERARVSSATLAVKIINMVKEVAPRAYIIHLNGPQVPGGCEKKTWSAWADNCCLSLKEIASQTVSPGCLCIENLQGYDISRLDPVLDNTDVGLCLDIGHLWVQKENPVDSIHAYGKRIKVVHLHGIKERDHQSLAHVNKEELKKVMDALHTHQFAGVLTLEVFNEDNLYSSLKVLEELYPDYYV